VRIYILPKLGTVPIASLRKAHVMKWRDDQATQFRIEDKNAAIYTWIRTAEEITKLLMGDRSDAAALWTLTERSL
jgi:hypothetical protein